MEEINPKIILAIARRWKYIILIPTFVLLTASLMLALFLPPVYQSSATILIEQQHIPSELVKSTVTSYADERIKLIEQRVMTVTNLSKVIDKYSVYANKREKLSQSELVDLFKENASVELMNADVTNKGGRSKATIAFKLLFFDKSSAIAQRVANELVTLFLSENVRARTQSAEETSKFLEEEAEKVRIETQKIENDIAEYKQKYNESLPELMPVNLSMISRIESDLEQLSLQEKLTTERRISLVAQLAATNPSKPVVSQGQNGNSHNTVSSLSELKALESSLLGKYNDSHPDVQHVRRQIENLEKEDAKVQSADNSALSDARQSLSLLKQKYSDDHPDVKALQRKIADLESKDDTSKVSNQQSQRNKELGINNPVYLQLKSEMDIAEVELQNIKMQRVSLQQKLQSLEKNISQTHQVERGYAELERDLENHKAKYQELRAKESEAKLAQTLEEEQKAESFTLIEPPVEAIKPIKPNRLKVFLIGIVISIGGGVGSGFLAEFMFGGVRGSSGLAAVTGFEPLVVIPYIPNKADEQRARRTWTTFWIASLVGILVLVLAIHFLYMPLDVLFYKVWERINLI
ncbi:Wzz/FepE/Etk N-terminal domain-containing protein [Methylomonas sp. AM2-LC]|uniref:GumC family protein n=1 Tax=Methylomonas sp. AM2-LC TaxID=3153301 RepID=UPI00326522F0